MALSPGLRLKAQEPGPPTSEAGENGCLSSSKERARALPGTFCSIQAPNGLDESHPHW